MGKPPSPACLISRQAKEASLMAIVLIVVVAVAVHFNYTKIITATTTVSFRFSEQMTSTRMLPEFLVWIALTGFFVHFETFILATYEGRFCLISLLEITVYSADGFRLYMIFCRS